MPKIRRIRQQDRVDCAPSGPREVRCYRTPVLGTDRTAETASHSVIRGVKYSPSHPSLAFLQYKVGRGRPVGLYECRDSYRAPVVTSEKLQVMSLFARRATTLVDGDTPMLSAGPDTYPASEWLESPFLETVVARAALTRGLGDGDLPDLVQNVRIALWENGLSANVSSGWVFRVATFKVVDLLRRRARDRRHERENARGARAPARDAEVDRILCIQVASLRPHLRRFFELHYRLALSEREIARELGICRASVRWLDRCCRRTLMSPGIAAKSNQGKPTRRKASSKSW